MSQPLMLQAHNWMPIPDFPEYEIHVNGLVRDKETKSTLRSFVGPVAPYLRVHLRKDHDLHEVCISPLVQTLFHGERRD